MTTTFVRSFTRLTTSLFAAFDVATTARKLGFFIDRDACAVNREGKCPGRFMCADCRADQAPRNVQ